MSNTFLLLMLIVAWAYLAACIWSFYLTPKYQFAILGVGVVLLVANGGIYFQWF